MSNKVDDRDWLYRMVRPIHHREGELSPDAYDDKYEAQSFNVVSVSSPRATLEKFAQYRGTRNLCGKKSKDADPTFLEMYDAGYRVAVNSVRFVREIGLAFRLSEDGDEYNGQTAHADVIGAKDKAAVLAMDAYVLTKEEMLTGFSPPVPAKRQANQD